MAHRYPVRMSKTLEGLLNNFLINMRKCEGTDAIASAINLLLDDSLTLSEDPETPASMDADVTALSQAIQSRFNKGSMRDSFRAFKEALKAKMGDNYPAELDKPQKPQVVQTAIPPTAQQRPLRPNSFLLPPVDARHLVLDWEHSKRHMLGGMPLAFDFIPEIVAPIEDIDYRELFAIQCGQIISAFTEQNDKPAISISHKYMMGMGASENLLGGASIVRLDFPVPSDLPIVNSFYMQRHLDQAAIYLGFPRFVVWSGIDDNKSSFFRFEIPNTRAGLHKLTNLVQLLANEGLFNRAPAKNPDPALMAAKVG